MATYKILLADENTEMLLVLALHLRNEEYEVICAADGQSALAAAKRELPDLILVDVGMEINERDRLFEHISDHRELARIPVIYLVGERAVRIGSVPRVPARSMIIKPVPTSELFEKIEQALTRPVRHRPAGMTSQREINGLS